ncbi:hypothetical protein [Planktothrix agardhii]|nr:hypothetical protein [Planktothrix agardhii]CAD5938052.1 hypothetical protein PCC7811_01743 [Planktothrix agardhii]
MTEPKIFNLINRLSFGVTPGQIQQVQQMGLDSFLVPMNNTLSDPML